MSGEAVSIGDRIQLQRIGAYPGGGHSEKVYTSQLLDITSPDTIHIAMPIERELPVRLPIGDEYYLWFYNAKGLFGCSAVIEDRLNIDNMYIYVVQLLSELGRVERREFYRLDCLLPVSYRVLSGEEVRAREEISEGDMTDEEVAKLLGTIQQAESDATFLDGVFIDISGGGARMTSTTRHQMGETIALTVDLSVQDEPRRIEILGELVRVSRMENNTGMWDNRIYFRDITKDQREAIVRYIFEKERQLIRQEKGFQ